MIQVFLFPFLLCSPKKNAKAKFYRGEKKWQPRIRLHFWGVLGGPWGQESYLQHLPLLVRRCGLNLATAQEQLQIYATV